MSISSCLRPFFFLLSFLEMLTAIGNEHLENYFLEVFAAKCRKILGATKTIFLHTICEIGENSGIFEISGMFEAFQLDS